MRSVAASLTPHELRRPLTITAGSRRTEAEPKLARRTHQQIQEPQLGELWISGSVPLIQINAAHSGQATLAAR
jgi:hypothetical protein